MIFVSKIFTATFKFLVYMVGTFFVVLLVHGLLNEKLREVYFQIPSIVMTSAGLSDPPIPRGMSQEIFHSLRQGGHTIFIRHSERDKDVENRSAFERFALNYEGGSHPTFRRGSCLTEEGKAEAWLLGQVFKKAETPIGTIYSSPICRTQETALLAFGRIDVVAPYLNYHRTKSSYVEMGLTTKEEKERSDQDFRTLVYRLPKKGSNNIIVAHAGQFRDVEGFDWPSFRLKESGVLILRHESKDKVTPITRATLEELVYALPLPSIMANAFSP